MNNNSWSVEPTQYEGLFKYIAPNGYQFWSGDCCYGDVIYGLEKLTNHYVLKKKMDK